MRLDDLGIALRTRSAWEATDLGFALVRANARRIWSAWLIVTLPVFVLVNALAASVDLLKFAPFVMWWLKPVFDRIVVFIVSRAVFGDAPSLRETLAAQWRWSWRAIAPWLLWRRLHPSRALLLPVDLLEGVRGKQRGERASVLGRGDGSTAAMLTFIGANLEGMLVLSFIALAMMFVPVEFLDESAKAVFTTLFVDPPAWAVALMNLGGWAATAIVEPFYVGAGFGLYLNRRMQLEAWDIELAFRRIAARLAATFAAIVFAFALGIAAPLHAAEPPVDSAEQGVDDAPSADAKTSTDEALSCPASDDDSGPRTTTLREMFGDAYRDDAAPFAEAVRNAYAGDDLRTKQRISVWKPRNASDDRKNNADMPAWARAIADVIGFVFEYGLWIIAALLLAIVAFNHRRWLPWISDRLPARREGIDPTLAGVDDVVALPDDIVGAVRALLRENRVRAALALFYRAGVERLVQSLGAPLPPGATEADCLRRARGLADTRYAALFARIVRAWQATAYAQRPPSPEEIEALLAQWNEPAQVPA